MRGQWQFFMFIMANLFAVTSADPPDFQALDCAIKQFAFEFGSNRIHSNIGALHDALHFSNCGGKFRKVGHVELPKKKPFQLNMDQGISLYVATNGDDSNAGTMEKPFLTIERARNEIRKTPVNERGPTTVYIRGGKYYLKETFVLNPEDSGTKENPIIYTNTNNEIVILSGGQPLQNLQWQTYKGAIKMANVGPLHFTSLFVNGSRQIRARYPNGNPQDASGLCFSKSQYPLESCTGYLSAKGGTKSQFPTHPGISIDLDQPKRGGQVNGDNHFPNFHYGIYEPIFNEPGYGPVFSYWNNPYGRRNQVIYDTNTWTKNTWSNPKTGLVHMFHNGLWGNWMFEIDNVNTANQIITFARGGWQEARGSDITPGVHYYVENIFEELDHPGEWFLDTTKQMLYFWPNSSDIGSYNFVAPQLESIVSIMGTPDSPVSYVIFNGLQFTESTTTFMAPYEVPSGGDWSIHRGGTFFIEGAFNVTLSSNLFNQVGGNAVFLSNYVDSSHIVYNEFVYPGDSAVAAVGSSQTIDGTQNTQPVNNIIANNHMHEIGVFGKQTSCYIQSLAYNTTLLDNVCYNGPRAGINFNDGFGGGNLVEGNLVFNMVRETGDHGPFNSWDRQPYITWNGKEFSIIPLESKITKNFMINGYNSVWTIDHDDGSAYYNDTENFMVYGGCKNYLGHDKTCTYNVIVYPGIPARSSGGRKCQTDDNGEFANQYYFGNQCVADDGNFYSFSGCTTTNLKNTVYQTFSNTFYSINSTFRINCGGQNLNFGDWQKLGQDMGSVVKPLPTVTEIINMGKTVLKP